MNLSIVLSVRLWRIPHYSPVDEVAAEEGPAQTDLWALLTDEQVSPEKCLPLWVKLRFSVGIESVL